MLNLIQHPSVKGWILNQVQDDVVFVQDVIVFAQDDVVFVQNDVVLAGWMIGARRKVLRSFRLFWNYSCKHVTPVPGAGGGRR